MADTAEIPNTLRLFPRRHLLLLALLLLMATLALLIPDQKNQRVMLPVALPTPDTEITADEPDLAASLPDWRWIEESVKSGDSLARIFQRVGISAGTLHQLVSSDDNAASLSRIFPGHRLRFALDTDNRLVALQYIPSQLEQLEFLRQEDGSYTSQAIVHEPEIRLSYHKAVIDDSLFLAGQNAGIPQGMIMQIANIFSGVIDFIYDPRKGDSFDILYEEKYLDGKKIGNGKLLAASYSNASETYTAYRYEYENGTSGYFNSDGISMRKPFLRAPLDFTRISSGFNLRRLHPVHKKIRAHRGIDYVAPTGTPVFAAGDGRVQRAGFSAANGNYVFISHGSTYTTKYLHLDKRFVRTGQQVKQRTVIGTVGSTGYSTGPHLHYEFLVNGVHRDPRTVLSSLPSADPIPADEKPRFNRQVQVLHNQYLQQQQQFAMSGSAP